MKCPHTLPIITPSTVTFILAYLQRYPCPWLPKQGTSPQHLQTMAVWLKTPAPKLRTARNHPYLAAHLAILLATNLVKVAGDLLLLQPDVANWLFACPQEQINRLLKPFAFPDCWEEHLNNLGWQETLPVDKAAYWQQQLKRQLSLPTPSIQDNVTLIKSQKEDAWYLHIPDNLAISLLFDLLQIGDWTPNRNLTCTPLTIADAVRRGMSYQFLTWLLETATGKPLDTDVKKQLANWSARYGAYRIQSGYLLNTKQPEQMAQLLANRRLNKHVQKQVGPRHALVSPDIIPSLARFLRKTDHILNAPETSPTANGRLEDTENLWLSTRILIGLREILPLSISPPHHTLAELAGRLSPTQQTALEYQAQAILSQLRTAIRGRDAFFPARNSPPPAFLDCIQEALHNETPLEITYQSPADYEPRYRRIQPLQLEQRGTLYYLHAYCYRAEQNLVFRLDRVHSLQPARQPS